MTPTLRWPILGVLVAIAATTTMDANGLLNFSALPLIPLTFLFWYLQRLPRQSMGFAWGQWHHLFSSALARRVAHSASRKPRLMVLRSESSGSR